MANNKKNIKNSKKTPSYIPTKKEEAAAVKEVEADMKRLGFKTLKEYIAYIDKKRGY